VVLNLFYIFYPFIDQIYPQYTQCAHLFTENTKLTNTKLTNCYSWNHLQKCTWLHFAVQLIYPLGKFEIYQEPPAWMFR